MSEEKRSQGLCPLTPEESALLLQALGFHKGTQIYIAAGEIYGSGRRLAPLRAAFPRIVSSFALFLAFFTFAYLGLLMLVTLLSGNTCALPQFWLSLYHK